MDRVPMQECGRRHHDIRADDIAGFGVRDAIACVQALTDVEFRWPSTGLGSDGWRIPRFRIDKAMPMTIRANMLKFTIGPGGVPVRTTGMNRRSSSAPRLFTSSRPNMNGIALRYRTRATTHRKEMIGRESPRCVHNATIVCAAAGG